MTNPELDNAEHAALVALLRARIENTPYPFGTLHDVIPAKPDSPPPTTRTFTQREAYL